MSCPLSPGNRLPDRVAARGQGRQRAWGLGRSLVV